MKNAYEMYLRAQEQKILNRRREIKYLRDLYNIDDNADF